MAKYKHLTLSDRIVIESMLKDKKPIKKIAQELGKDPTTISKEIRAHLIKNRTGGFGINYNACIHRYGCKKSHLCSPCKAPRRYSLCRRCFMCNFNCDDFQEEVCSRLKKKPHVCNGCGYRGQCSLEKRYYSAEEAHQAYQARLSESRSGISLNETELSYLDELITPLIRQQQSPHHVCVALRDRITVSERTIYRLIETRAISAMNLDLPRKVRFRPRKKAVHAKVDKACRIGRDYTCFKAYTEEHPDTPVVQLDTVEGVKGGKVLLTIHFTKAEMMLAFLREHNDSQSVIDIFESLYLKLGGDNFKKVFPLCLADNGTEFSNPSAIESDRDGNSRTRIFYCDPSAPYQKGSAERNHEFIRYFFPKGYDFSSFTQQDVLLMMDHINSYSRQSLGDKSPYEMFAFLYGSDILESLGCHRIPPQAVTLNRSIFRKEAAEHVR